MDSSANSLHAFYKRADVYPSAFQWIEQPLYYLNKDRNKNIKDIQNGKDSPLNSSLGFCKFLVISYIAWPIIMCATPFTAVIDMTLGICEAFYAKYKGATSHQISLILQKKLIASPIQHVVYLIINLVFPVFFGIAFFLGSPSFSFALGMGLCIAPMMALPCYHIAQQVIGSRLPAWTHPEGFNIFTNHGCQDPGGKMMTDEDYDEEAEFRRWQQQKSASVGLNEKIFDQNQDLQLYQNIINRYDHPEFKKFFNAALNKADIKEILGLPSLFSQAQLKQRYRYWALVLHPDKHTDPAIKKVAEILFKNVLCPAREELEV